MEVAGQALGGPVAGSVDLEVLGAPLAGLVAFGWIPLLLHYPWVIDHLVCVHIPVYKISSSILLYLHGSHYCLIVLLYPAT